MSSPNRLYSEEIPYDPQRHANERVFVGRNRMVDQMLKGLCSGHSYGLIGKAGMGKTSILFALKRRIAHGLFKEIMLVVYISLDERHLGQEKGIVEDIISGFINALDAQCGLVVPSPERDRSVKEARQGRLAEALRTLSDWYYQQRGHSCQLVVLLDDLHRGLGHDILGETVSMLRPLVSSGDMAIKISLVLSGELPLQQEFRNDVSSLRALLSDTIVLAPLLPNDVATLVELAKDYGWSVEEGCEEVAFTLTNGHPYMLHYYLHKALSQHRRISQLELRQIHADLYTKDYLDSILKLIPSQLKQGRVIHLFYSYADSDKSWLEELEKQFSYLRKESYIQDWHVGKLKGGDEREEQISKHLRQANVVLLLISPDYVSSGDLARQAQIAMERRQADNVFVIPILLRPVADWKKEPYGTLQAFPRDGRWISGHPDSDQALKEIAEEISSIVARLREQ
jgi:hypothetical protein